MEATLSVGNTLYKKASRVKKRRTASEDREVLQILDRLKSDLDCLQNNFDYVTDPILIDGYIYEIKAIQLKYQYYLKLCKERGIFGDERSVT